MKYFFAAFFVLSLVFMISRASYSQDKNYLIAFSSDASKNNKKQIFIMGSHGENVKQVCKLNLDCFLPRFSPDGRKIIFTAKNNVSDFLYMIDLDDSSTFSFPKFIDGGSDPHFSPDGKYLVYQSEKNLDNNVYIMNLETDSSVIASDGSLSAHAKFSPDGNKIIYSSSAYGNFDLVVLDLFDTTEDAQLTIADTKDAEMYGTFSPDGKSIAYASFDINYKGTVHICDQDGNNNLSISRGMGSSYDPKFSPDGTKLAFLSNSGGNIELYICNADGSNINQLTHKNGRTDVFDWSGDSQSLVYDNIKDEGSSINVININSGKNEDLTGENAVNINPNFQK